MSYWAKKICRFRLKINLDINNGIRLIAERSVTLVYVVISVTSSDIADNTHDYHILLASTCHCVLLQII